MEPDLCDSYFRKKRDRQLAALRREHACELERAEELMREQLQAKPDDISDKGYSVLCSSIGRIASVNAILVASIKKALVTPNAAEFDDVTLEEMRDVDFDALHDPDRSTVLVHMADNDEHVPIDQIDDVSRLRRHMRQAERQVMVACFHKAHVDSLERRLVRSGVPPLMIGKYYGDCSPEERHNALHKRIVLLTYAMAEEGLDCPTANSMVIADPRGNSSLQTIGRILRDKMVTDIMPLVVHCCHAWCTLDEGLFWARQRQFKAYPHIVRTVNIGTPAGLVAATSTISFDSELNERAKSGNVTPADLRLNEVGAVSSRNVRRQRAPDAAVGAKNKRKSREEKAERSASRKQARIDRRQEHLAHSVAAAQGGTIVRNANDAGSGDETQLSDKDGTADAE